ncbi:MAG: PCMD domain-containing protein [Muribaculaceae bacterium]|nr:PCMD domain-containing protein [Muribaculaceae bacterium]
MKEFNLTLIGAVMAVGLVACNEDPFSDGGEGRIIINPVVNTDMDVITRADEQALKDNFLLWISNSKGLVRRYDNETFPSSPIPLVSDHYVAEAWAGDSVPASFDHIWYKGMTEFDVTSNSTASVTLECKIANVGVSVKYDGNIGDVLSDYYMTVGHKGGLLLFKDEDASKRGYFMMPSFDKNLSYELKGKQIDGSDFSFSGVIESPKPHTEYILNVLCEQKTTDVGGAIFTITIDEREIEVKTPIEIVTAPIISGYGFDISKPVVSDEGQVGRKCVYISSAASLGRVVIENDLLQEVSGYSDLNLLGMTDEIKGKLEDFGINYSLMQNNEEGTLMQINFEEKLTDALPTGDYIFKILAEDSSKRTTTASLDIMISDALVLTQPIQDENTTLHYSAVLYGIVAKDGVNNVGFKYKKVKEENWNTVYASLTRAYSAGQTYSVELTGLSDNTEYEYKAVSDDYESIITERFKTLECLQLPNAGFEEWSMEGNVHIPGASYATTFWDTGNHGSTTLGEQYNLTVKSEDYKHGGQYSAKLQTRWVIAKLGAGNLFAGNYLRTDGTNGEIGFGRPFKAKPKSVKLWVKYTPGTKVRGSGKYIKSGMNDQGQIYVALTDDNKETYSQSGNRFNNTQWPFIVKTKTQKLFDPTAPNVIAYGEKSFTTATEGDGLIQIEINLDYYRDNIIPSNIVFVASASKYGDYFEGCDDSTMYIDDIQIEY